MKKYKLVAMEDLILCLMWVFLLFINTTPSRFDYIVPVSLLALFNLMDFVENNIVEHVHNKKTLR